MRAYRRAGNQQNSGDVISRLRRKKQNEVPLGGLTYVCVCTLDTEQCENRVCLRTSNQLGLTTAVDLVTRTKTEKPWALGPSISYVACRLCFVSSRGRRGVFHAVAQNVGTLSDGIWKTIDFTARQNFGSVTATSTLPPERTPIKTDNHPRPSRGRRTLVHACW